MKSVTPYVEANGFWNPFTGMKKWTITCGACEHTWKEKVPFRETCSSVCPCCKTQNKWSAGAFLKDYNARR